MTPPRTPDSMSDDIVDMTPANLPQDDSDEIVDMTPTFSPGDESTDFVDVTATSDVLKEEPVETFAQTSEHAPERMPKEQREAFPSPLPERPREEPRAKQRKTTRNRWKYMLVALAGIAALAFAGHETLGKSMDIGSISMTSGSTGAQSTSIAATSTPTVKSVQIENKLVTTTVGPLILLNPGVVRQGANISVTGSGFDSGAVVDLTIRRQGSSAALASTFVQADKGGAFSGSTLAVPMSLSAGSFIVVAHERNGSNSAQAVGTIAGGAAQVKLGLQVGKPGDVVVLALHGFAPGETINVYWNTLNGQPLTTFQADSGGSVGQGKLQVPNGAVGDNTFLFVGAKSQSLIAANFLVLQLYPTVKLSSYALQADNIMSFSGTGFGPGERVLVFLNNTNGQPFAVVPTDSGGSFKNAQGFVLPFVLKGKQTLIFMGEQSRAPATVSFTVLPYAPVVEPSTYGGLPGTAITFYVSGFAHDEVVHVYAGHTKDSMGTMVSCFQTDNRGGAGAVGSYLIPGDAQGTLGFALVGTKSGGVGSASVKVAAPPSPVQTSPQAPFTCPLDSQARTSQPTKSSQTATPPASSSRTPGSTTPTAPQGDLQQPSRQIALAPIGSPHGYMASVASSASAAIALLVTPLVMPRPFNVQVSVRSFLLGSILIGMGLIWLVVAAILTGILVRRGHRLTVRSPLQREVYEPRGESSSAESGHRHRGIVKEGLQTAQAHTEMRTPRGALGESEETLAQLARTLGLPAHGLYRWRQQFREQQEQADRDADGSST